MDRFYQWPSERWGAYTRLIEQRLEITPPMQNVHDLDDLVVHAIEDQIFANRKAAVAGTQLLASPPGMRGTTQKLKALL